MRIAVLGTGQVGRTLAAGLDAAGHEVTVGTRDPDATSTRDAGPREDEPYAGWASRHPGVGLATLHAAAEGAEVVLNALPGSVTLDGLEAIGEDLLAGKVLWDVANPLDFSHGAPPALSPGNTDSLAQTVQRAFPNAHVVKALNTVNISVMVQPAGPLADTHLPMAGDDDGAKAVVVGLLGDLGWAPDRIVDLGGLEHARGMESYLTLWFSMAQTLGSPTFNVRIVRPD